MQQRLERLEQDIKMTCELDYHSEHDDGPENTRPAKESNMERDVSYRQNQSGHTGKECPSEGV